jgi:hypothetical protein
MGDGVAVGTWACTGEGSRPTGNAGEASGRGAVAEVALGGGGALSVGSAASDDVVGVLDGRAAAVTGPARAASVEAGKGEADTGEGGTAVCGNSGARSGEGAGAWNTVFAVGVA